MKLTIQHFIHVDRTFIIKKYHLTFNKHEKFHLKLKCIRRIFQQLIKGLEHRCYLFFFEMIFFECIQIN